MNDVPQCDVRDNHSQQQQIDKINDGLKRLTKNIGAGMMITQPAVSYV